MPPSFTGPTSACRFTSTNHPQPFLPPTILRSLIIDHRWKARGDQDPYRASSSMEFYWKPDPSFLMTSFLSIDINPQQRIRGRWWTIGGRGEVEIDSLFRTRLAVCPVVLVLFILSESAHSGPFFYL